MSVKGLAVNMICKDCNRELDEAVDYIITYYYPDNKEEYFCRPCDKNARLKQYNDSGHLSIRLILDAILDRDKSETWADIRNANERISSVVKKFESAVWFNGLQEIARKSKYKGNSYKCDDFEMLIYTMAGRAMITIENKIASVTMITAEDEPDPCMGLQGIQATEADATMLIEMACEKWPEYRKKIKPNKNVSII